MQIANEGRDGSSRSAWSSAPLQGEAFRLLQDFRTGALKPGATEIDRINVETAEIIVEIAEKKSQLIDRQAATSMVAELKSRGEQLVKAHAEDVQASLSAGAQGSGCAAVSYSQKNSLERLAATIAEFRQRLDQHAWNAWNEACEELIAMQVGRRIADSQGQA